LELFCRQLLVTSSELHQIIESGWFEFFPAMKTVATFRLLLVFIVSVSTPLLANGCKTVEGEGFGTALDPVTVDYNMLMPDMQASSHPAVELEDESGPKMEAFYKKMVWAPYNCFKGSTLRDGISAYWFPNLLLARPAAGVRNERYYWIGNGVYAWYVEKQDSFYIFFWANNAHCFGPFKGHPLQSFKSAIKPRRSHRSIPGVSLAVVSQRWEYPDPKDARSPRNWDYYPLYDHESGSERELRKFSTFFTRIRLTNKSPSALFYLAGQGPSALYGTHYDASAQADFFHRAEYSRIFGAANWVKLSPGESVELEVKSSMFKAGAQERFTTLVNTEPVFWDEIEVSITYPMMFRNRSLLDEPFNNLNLN
jgi:hypothetical protein